MNEAHYARIADVYDAFVSSQYDVPFFIEEAKKAGGEVLELMAGTGRLTIPLLEAGIPLTCLDFSAEMLAVLRDKLAARGLAAAHALGIVHCDVKPENLFVVGNERHVKVLDFDLSWMPDAPEHGERHVLRGTAKYMAPEQIVGDQVDARTDVYSLGVVLFRMLTGHLPFDLELGATLLRHQVSSPIPPPSWGVFRM